jgi:hypothetical protein
MNYEDVVGRLSEGQTTELCMECLRNLPADIVSTAIVEALSIGDLHEVHDEIERYLARTEGKS